jgi:hypothetical protein
MIKNGCFKDANFLIQSTKSLSWTQFEAYMDVSGGVSDVGTCFG